jgi:hypothetical protein
MWFEAVNVSAVETATWMDQAKSASVMENLNRCPAREKRHEIPATYRCQSPPLEASRGGTALARHTP